MTINVALWEPEIPPNTGNIGRLCVANDVPLHLIGKLGFLLDDKNLRRAGLDYWDLVDLHLHDNFENFERQLTKGKLYCYSAHAERNYASVTYSPDDWLLFGCESYGLPAYVRERNPECVLTVPMLTTNVRSLNLATTVGIVLYEALRQIHQW